MITRKWQTWIKKGAFFWGFAFCGSFVANGFPLKFQEEVLLWDSEIEEILENFLKPVFKKTGSSNVNLYLLYSNSVNAFATENRTIFILTGLIQEIQTIDELMAVLLHELGHVEKNHGFQTMDFINRLKKYHYAGLAAAIAASLILLNPAPLASMIAYETSLQAFGGTFSRVQESCADQFALNLMTSMKWPIQGFADFMNKLYQKERVIRSEMYPYFATHPFSDERAGAVERYLQKAKPQAKQSFPPYFYENFQILKTKVVAYCSPLKYCLQAIKALPVSEECKKYGLAIANYRLGRMDESLKHLNSYYQKTQSPFANELKAQIFLEKNQLPLALDSISKAMDKRPSDPYLAALKAQILLTMNNPKKLDEIIRLLERVLMSSKDVAHPWYWLGIAYGRKGNHGRMNVCLAERSLFEGQLEKAKTLANKALKQLKPNDRYYLKAEELILAIEQAQKFQ